MAHFSTAVPSIFQCQYLGNVSTSGIKGRSRAIISTGPYARGPQGTYSLVIAVFIRLLALLQLTLHFSSRMAGSFILNLTYGIDVQSADDPYVQMAEHSAQGISDAGNPGSFLVDILPIRAFLNFPHFIF
jgi:hypothetical protein